MIEKLFDESIELAMKRTFAYSRWTRSLYSVKSTEELKEIVRKYNRRIFRRIWDEIIIFPSLARIEYDAAIEILEERKEE